MLEGKCVRPATTDYTFDAKLYYNSTTKTRSLSVDVGDATKWLSTALLPFEWTKNHWYHVTIAVDDAADQLTAYVDGRILGILAFTTAGSPRLTDGTRVLKIGSNGRDSITPQYWNGDIDEVAIWKGVLTPPQVRSHELAGRSVAWQTTTTQYDDNWRPIQVDDQLLENGGFESLLTGWDLNAGTGGSSHVAASDPGADPALHQSTASNLSPSWGSFETGTTGVARQVVQLVPGQTVRVQAWAKPSAISVLGTLSISYWRRSDGTWVSLKTGYFIGPSWRGLAYDVTLPFDTDGRLRIDLRNGTYPTAGTVYFDDVAIFTTYARTAYTATAQGAPFEGLLSDAYTLAPTQSGPIAEYAEHTSYAGTAVVPPVFPTTVIQNATGAAFDPATPDRNVSTSATFDAWGHQLTETDQDGVTTTTSFVSSAGAVGYATDVASTNTGMPGETTTFTYDEVGNKRTETTPRNETTTTVYDLRNHATEVTDPLIQKTRNVYDTYGYLTSSIANYEDGTPGGGTGLDDVVTAYEYDVFGAQTRVTQNTGLSGTTAVSSRTDTTHDLLGNPVATTVYAAFDGATFSAPRTTTSYFDTALNLGADGVAQTADDTTAARPRSSGTRGPITTTDSAVPSCPGAGSSLRCNTVSALDPDGQAIAATDVYGVTSRTLLDFAGKTTVVIANYVDGVYVDTAPDADVMTWTTNDLFGRATVVIDTLGHRTETEYDALGRTTRVTRYATDGTAGSQVRTAFTGAGRTDRVSLAGQAVDAIGDPMPDASFTWTKTVYDRAGRAIKTLAHYDITGNAGLHLDSFETPETDITIDFDGTEEAWAGGTGTFIAGGTISRQASAMSAMAGAGRLAVTTVASQDSGTEWSLDGTFLSGHLYKARVWVNAASGTTITAKLGVAGDATTDPLPTVSGDGTWKSLDVTWTPTANRTGARLAVYRAATTGIVTFYLDDAAVWDAASGFTDVNISTEIAYDLDGHVVASVVAPGTVGGTDEPMVTRTAYDALGRPTSVTVNEIAGGGTTDPAFNLTTLTHYDALGRSDTSTDPTGTVTRYEYDRLGRVITTFLNYLDGSGASATSADDVKSTYWYDAAGELTGFCPAAQVWAVDGVDACHATSGSDPTAWHYTYDDAGQLIIQVPPVNTTAAALATTRWEYDAGGRQTAACDVIAGTDSCAEPSGVLRTILPSYDAQGRITQTDIRSGNASGTLALRTTTSYFGDGQPRDTRSYEGSTPTQTDWIDQTYDPFGRLDLVRRDAATVLTDFTYNADDTLASRVDGDDSAIGQSRYTYDWAQRLRQVTLPGGFATATATFTWRLDGLVASRSWAAGTAATFSYDRAKRPTRIDKGTIAISQAFDRDGNATADGRSFPNVSGDPGTGTQTFTYDALNRVTGSSGLSTAADRTYTYDRDGNRLTKGEGTVTFSYTYDRTDELVSVVKTGGTSQSFTYDARGNQIGDAQSATGVTAYTYDLANKLTGIDAGGIETVINDATFTFDAFGRFRTRVLATASGTDTYSYVGTSETVVRIANTISGVTTNTDSIVAPAGDRIGVKVGDSVNWFLPDLHGDIAGSLTQDETKLANAIRYDAYGQTIATGSAAGATPVGEKAWKYQGNLDISPAGLATPLYDMSARYYSPGIGAFTQLDTVMGTAQNPLSMNRYLYAGANPWTLVDPTGHWFGLDNLVAGIAGAVVGGVTTLATGVMSGEGIKLDHIVAGAAGGAVEAEVLLQTGNPWLASAAGGATTNATQQVWDIAAGNKSEFDWGSLASDTVTSAAMGGIADVAMSAVKPLANKVTAAASDFAGSHGISIPGFGSSATPSAGGSSGKPQLQTLDDVGPINLHGEGDPRITWVDEHSKMGPAAQDFNDMAPGARCNVATRCSQAPALKWTDPTTGKPRVTRFDGVDTTGPSPVMIDMKGQKTIKQAARQDQALAQNGLSGRWVVPRQSLIRPANRALTKTSNIRSRLL